MKKIIFALVTMLTLATQAQAMSYEQARNEALFLTDKMAYELNLTDAQYEAAYEINLDYLMSVTGRDDVFGLYWERRNADLNYILYSWQWEAFRAATYFFRPLYWDAGYWHFGIYAHYPRRDFFYFGRPHFYASYRGGHSWRMNGGRSYYEGRHDYFRPDRGGRDHHVGMRNSWDRGDYRGSHGSSSTRFTGGARHNDNGGNGGYRDNGGNRNGGGYRDNGGNRNGGGQGYGNGNGNHNGGSGNFGGSRSNGNGNFGGSRSNGGGSVNHTTPSGGSSNHDGGSFSGSRSSGSSSHGGGSFSGSRSGGGSGGGATRSGGNSGSSRGSGSRR